MMMEAAKTSETLVKFYQTTRRYNPEDSHLRTHRRENLKSYNICSASFQFSGTLLAIWLAQTSEYWLQVGFCSFSQCKGKVIDGTMGFFCRKINNGIFFDSRPT
jgi:hypothetical protein